MLKLSRKRRTKRRRRRQMVFNYFSFIPGDPDARPGSPHHFFSQISSASSSPDASCGNCIGRFSPSVASTHRRHLPIPGLQNRDPVRFFTQPFPICLCNREALRRSREVEDEADDEVGEALPDRNYAGSPTNQIQRRVRCFYAFH